MLMPFIRKRGTSLAAVILVLALTTLLQTSVSYTVTFGPLHLIAGTIFDADAVMVVLQFSLLALMILLWLRSEKPALFRCIILSNALFTLTLLMQTFSLARIVSGISHNAVNDLLADVALVALINILIFSIWYWIIDPPGVDEAEPSDQPWDFLFVQRASPIAHCQNWVPHYIDYLFLAYTASFAFSPTDVMPLTKRAKALMMLQATISIVTLTGLAGTAINILASGG